MLELGYKTRIDAKKITTNRYRIRHMKKNCDDDIIDRILNGDIESFEFIVKKYEKSLFVMVGNLLGSVHHRVEDIVQETFLAAYKNLNTYDSSLASFSTWLYRIARNKCLNEQNKKKEKPLKKGFEISDKENPVNSVLSKELFHVLDNALNQLSFNERVVFVLAEFEGLSHGEIAAIENIRTGTVKSRLSRTKAKLRTIIKKYAK